MKPSSEVVELIETLQKTEERLAVLTGGEVDSVMSGQGQTFLLRQAQDGLLHSGIAQQTTILELQSVNEELELFSSTVSHDLRAPLGHIQCFVELLQERMGRALSADNLGYLETISQAAKNMSRLIEDLLTFAQTAHIELKKTDIDMGPLVSEVVKGFASEVQNRDIAWSIRPLPHVWGDRALLRMALVNLTSNALKFTRERVRAEIEIGCAADEGDNKVLFIRDNGAGFDQKSADKLFGVFQRLHAASQFEGTGIGLANVRRIIQRHGGRTWAHGVVQGGATFYFSVPGKP